MLMPRTGLQSDGNRIMTEIDMKLIKFLTWVMGSLAITLTALPSLAADYPAPQEGSWIMPDFRFHDGETLPELRLHYRTVGAPTGEPVLILHRTAASHPRILPPPFPPAS